MGANACCASEITQMELTHDPFLKSPDGSRKFDRSMLSPKEPPKYQEISLNEQNAKTEEEPKVKK